MEKKSISNGKGIFEEKTDFEQKDIVEKGVSEKKKVSENRIHEMRIVSDLRKNTIGENIRWFREAKKMRQTEMVARLQLYRVAITREALVKIEGGRQHIKLSQLRGIKYVLGVSYEDILDEAVDRWKQ